MFEAREITINANENEHNAAHLVMELWRNGGLRLGVFIKLLGCMIAEKGQFTKGGVGQVTHKTGLLLIEAGNRALAWQEGVDAVNSITSRLQTGKLIK